MSTGEVPHYTGADGAARAKRWLERTTRAHAPWVNPEKYAQHILSFPWHDRYRRFSFDLAGYLVGGELDNQWFFAESKKYKAAADQGQEYRHFLAKCYVALREREEFCHNFMWITWAPFLSTRWDQLTTTYFVKESVLMHPQDVFGLGDGSAALDVDMCKQVAERTWIIVLSEKQESLTITDEHFKIVRGLQAATS